MSKIVQLEIPFDFEEFRDIKGFEGLYQISNQGRVYSLISKRFLKPRKTKLGYLDVVLYNNGKHKHHSVHRLVAQAFIPNPLHLPIINHISENKTENFVSNLEWCDYSYNNTYGSRTEKMMQNHNFQMMVKNCSKPIIQMTKDGKFVNEYPSIREAARTLGINHQNIMNCLKKEKYKSAGGYIWRYKNVS